MNKNTLGVLLSCLFAFTGIRLAHTAEEMPLVALTQIVEHPSLDAIRQGIIDELAAEGFHDKENVRYEYESAQGNGAIALQIAEKFAGEHPAAIVAIATPSAQAAVSAVRGQYPVVFASVTDPVAAKLVNAEGKPLKNTTGTSDAIPVAQQVGLIQRILPQMKTLGTIYNPGDANSAATTEKLKKYLQTQGIELISTAATKSSEVADAANALVGRADAVYIGLDNTVVSALETLLQIGKQNHLPVFSADTDSVKRGSIAALGFDYYDVGRLTGKQVSQILKGSKPEDIPVATVTDNLRLAINPAAAKEMGVVIPEALLKEANVTKP